MGFRSPIKRNTKVLKEVLSMKTISIYLEKYSELNELAKKISYAVSTGSEYYGFGMPKHEVEKYLKKHPESEPIINRLTQLCSELNELASSLY